MKRFYGIGLFILCAFAVMAATRKDVVIKVFGKTMASAAGPGDTARGLIGYYYNERSGHNTFDTLVFSRVDSITPYLEVYWGYNTEIPGSPDPRIHLDWFSIRWVGLVEAPQTGYYDFVVYPADMARVYVDGQLILDKWSAKYCCQNLVSDKIYLEKGHKYSFVLEYGATTGYAEIYFGWDLPDGTGGHPPTSAFYAIVPRVVAAPGVEPRNGLFEEEADVTLTSPTSNAVIHYTLDGSDPTSGSPVYDSTVVLTSSATFKARAFADGMTPSSIVTRTYTIIPTLVSTPTLYPTEGIYGEPINLTFKTADDGTTIYYTLDGSNPDTNSLQYSGPVTIDSTTRVKVFAVKPGMSPSNVASATYTILPPAASAPVFSVPGGSYNQPEQVTITSATPGAVIRYAFNDDVLNDASPVYTTPITIDKTTTLKAFAEKGTLRASKVTKATYTFSTEETRVAAPQFSLPPGHYDAVQQVNITTDTKGASIYYTTDGSKPDENSSLFFAPILVNDSITLKAYAAKPGMAPSDIVSATYVAGGSITDTGIINDKLPTPELTIYPNPATDFARISWDNMVYTLDGAYLTVTDSKGVVMKHINIKGGYTYYDLQTSTFADGVYYIRIQSGLSTVYGKLIIGR